MKASLASCHIVFALMVWLLCGGVSAILHISIIVRLAMGYVVFKIIEELHRDTGAELYAT